MSGNGDPQDNAVELKLPTNFFQKFTMARLISSFLNNAAIFTVLGGVAYTGAQLYADEYIDTVIKEKSIVLMASLKGDLMNQIITDKKLVVVSELKDITKSVDELIKQQEEILRRQSQADSAVNAMQRDGAVDRSILRGLENDQKDLNDNFKELNTDIKSILRVLRSNQNNQ